MPEERRAWPGECFLTLVARTGLKWLALGPVRAQDSERAREVAMGEGRVFNRQIHQMHASAIFLWMDGSRAPLGERRHVIGHACHETKLWGR